MYGTATEGSNSEHEGHTAVAVASLAELLHSKGAILRLTLVSEAGRSNPVAAATRCHLVPWLESVDFHAVPALLQPGTFAKSPPVALSAQHLVALTSIQAQLGTLCLSEVAAAAPANAGSFVCSGISVIASLHEEAAPDGGCTAQLAPLSSAERT